jgi:hypothetical protein
MNKVIQRNTFCIRFLIIKSKKNKNGEHPIYCRVPSNGKRKEFATGIWIQEKKWNGSGERVIGTTETSQTFNYTLSSYGKSEADLAGKYIFPEFLRYRRFFLSVDANDQRLIKSDFL